MKIIYLTDIHDGLNGLKNVFQQTSPNLYMLSGDIIYKAFFSADRIIEFCTYQEELEILAKNAGEDITPYDYATRVIRFSNKYSEEIQQSCIRYRELFNKAAKTMKEKYQIIEKLIKNYAGSPCILLPGNYDIDLQYTALYELDIHRKSMEFGGLKFSGYGGAPITTSGIPQKLAVKFHEYNKYGHSYSEPEDFFKEELPDIAMIHDPAYGFLDKIPGFGNIGSQGIRRYLDEAEKKPSLVVSGHVHEDQGILKKGKTVFLNPSNFGAVDSVYGFQPGGFFAEITIDNKLVSSVGLYRLIEGEKKHLMEVNTTEKILKADYIIENSPVSEEEFVRR